MDLRLAVVQATSFCNLDCRYCYVDGRREPARITEEVLDALLGAVFDATAGNDEVELLWHLGEPLAAGVAFYEHAFARTEALRPASLRVEHTFQTNATLVTPTWARFLADHGVRVGVSIDGPAWLHDRHRPTRGGRGTHARTVRGIRQLQDAGLHVGAIAVLTSDSLRHPDEIYDFFVDLGIRTVAFNVEETEGVHDRSALADDTGVEAAYRSFVDRLWQRWRAEPARLQVREFDRLLRVLGEAKRDPSWHRVPDDVIGFRSIAVDRLGNVTTFSPELAGQPGWILGNVTTSSLASMAGSAAYAVQAEAVTAGVAACAASCPWFRLCGGGFVSNKYFELGSVRETETLSCRLHRQVLADVVLDGLLALAHSPASARSVPSPTCHP